MLTLITYVHKNQKGTKMTATMERPTTQAQPDNNKEPWSQLSELDALLDEPQDNTGNQPAETLEPTAMPSERAGSRQVNGCEVLPIEQTLLRTLSPMKKILFTKT